MRLRAHTNSCLWQDIFETKTQKRKAWRTSKLPDVRGISRRLVLMLLSPFTELFSFDVTVFNFFLLGWLSSGTSYVFNTIFGDNGIQYSQKMELSENEDY